ncbi:MAG: DUF1517 domain-containing protein [Chloroflexaceae bacterium]|nr:DUF1517 domain-containing protein [Chloroflexaceae bacterium]
MRNFFKTALKSILVLGLVLTLILSNTGRALAASSGGRIGGGSFRAPSRTFSPPSGGGYGSPRPGYGYPGGGFGFPFLLPFFGFGGAGSLFTILVFFAIANFLVRSFRNTGMSGEASYGTPAISVAKVQVGLRAQARELQEELNELGETADTTSATGRALVLQEASLALLRHPQYWVYGASESQSTRLETAEAKFNQLALAERSKFSEETLSNVENQRRLSSTSDSTAIVKPIDEPGEYIVVTLIAGVEGQLPLPTINDTEDLQQALKQLGGVGSDRLLAVEVLWTPQAEGDTLTSDDLLAYYPNLKLV